MPRIRAHEVLEDDMLDIAGKKMIVTDVSHGYCGPEKISILMYSPADPAIFSSLLVPRHYKLYVNRPK